MVSVGMMLWKKKVLDQRLGKPSHIAIALFAT